MPRTLDYSKRIKWFYIVIASDSALAGERACTPKCWPLLKQIRAFKRFACLREAASAKAGHAGVAISPRNCEIAEPVPNKVRNLRVCHGFASQPFHSSQRQFIKICQNTPQLCWGDEWPPLSPGGRGLGLRLGRAYGSER